MRLMEARLRPTYNCCHFLCDAWEQETGSSLRDVMAGFLATPRTRTAEPTLTHTLRRLSTPQGPCVVLWRRRVGAPHVGLYVRGQVLHLTDTGPVRQLLDVASIGYMPPRFYAPR